ncbi:MAG: DUF883 C-terminal domain-containing protein [Ahrensia sp.]
MNVATKVKSTARKTAASGTDSDLYAQLESLKSDISVISERLSRIGETGMQEAIDQGSKAKSKGIEKTDELIADLYAQLGEIEKKASHQVKSNPVQSLGIAAAVGFLAAMIVRR